MTSTVFLSAQWRHLVMINYEIDPGILEQYVPKGTQLDLWKGKAYVSLVGFMFLDTRVRGISVPFYRNFEEINLRFYIKHSAPEGERRGVAFIKEIVPSKAVAYIARRVYNEKYIALPMCHRIEKIDTQISVEYGCKFNGKWEKFGVRCSGDPQPIVQGSDVEFITEHYWGYSVYHDGETISYEVQHPRWNVWNADHCEVDEDLKSLYDPVFTPFLEKPPASAFLADGSTVQVFKSSILNQ